MSDEDYKTIWVNLIFWRITVRYWPKLGPVYLQRLDYAHIGAGRNRSWGAP